MDKHESLTNNWQFELFYDGDCPLCRREVRWLKSRDRHRKIKWTNIADVEWDAGPDGLSYPQLMERIHGRFADGRIVSGVEVFRVLYQMLGFGFVVAPTRWPILREMSEWLYERFAKHRLKLTGRCHAQGCELGKHRVSTKG